jgi:hypothetical protein
MRYVAGALNDYNYSEPTYADQVEIPCSFADEGGSFAVPKILEG